MHRYLAAMSLAVLAAASAGAANAQGMTAPKPTLGVLAGVNFATIGGNDVKNLGDIGNRTGLAIGGFATFHLQNGWGIEPELLFSQKGASVSGTGGSGTVKLDYIEIPVLARYDLATKGPAHPFFLAGPSLAFQVGCSVDETSDGISQSGSCDAAGLSKKSFDFGGLLGAGVAFPAGKKMNLSLSLRYTLGFVDTFDNTDAKNRAWSLLAGLTF